MTTAWLNDALRHLIAAGNRDDAGLGDGELLTRFLGNRGEAALAALVRRHAPMVWGVCRRQLPNPQDAEDAFQATFLVLVRKAASVSPRDAVGNWLHGVAHKTALRVRTANARRARRERQVEILPEPSVSADGGADWLPAIDAEIARLPDRYRAVVVLCDLQDVTRKDAAERLGLPEGTVASRLVRARAMLGKRLVRRGVATAAVAAGGVPGVAAAGVPASLLASTIEAARLTAAGQAVAGAVSPAVAALTAGVTRAMFVNKIKVLSAVALLVGFALAGVGVGAGDNKDAVPAAGPAAPRPAKAVAAAPAQKTAPAQQSALEKKLVGAWVGEGACVGNTVFQADGTYHRYGYGPAAGLFESGTWKIEWNELPPTLVLKPWPTEGAADEKGTGYFLMKLNGTTLNVRWDQHEDSRVEEHSRGTAADDVAVRINILNSAVQRYLGNEKHGGGVKLPPDLKTLVDTKILPSADSLLDPWGGEFRYDVSGKNNQGKRPDIWTETKDGKVVGNWMIKR